MKWRDVPEGVSLSMDKETAMSMQGGGKLKSALVGAVVGGILVASVIGDGDSAAQQPTPNPTPSASSSRT